MRNFYIKYGIYGCIIGYVLQKTLKKCRKLSADSGYRQAYQQFNICSRSYMTASDKLEKCKELLSAMDPNDEQVQELLAKVNSIAEKDLKQLQNVLSNAETRLKEK